jgi:hypothetical protein
MSAENSLQNLQEYRKRNDTLDIEESTSEI